MLDKLQSHYDLMWSESLKLFEQNTFEIDTEIQSMSDTRQGITLIAKLSSAVTGEVVNCTNALKNVEPDQYYYDIDSFHITVLPIISCDKNFLLSHVNPNEYITVINKAVKNINPFDILFKGITASPSCVLLQGFPRSNELLLLRNNLRIAFDESSLKSTIDSRYKITTAHSTICRFQQAPSKPIEFTQVLVDFRCTEFKHLHVKELHLVYNDWYHKADKTIVLSKITL